MRSMISPAVKVRRRLRFFYFGDGHRLMAAGVAGGHLRFVGLRGADGTLSMIGAGVIGLGVLFDGDVSGE